MQSAKTSYMSAQVKYDHLTDIIKLLSPPVVVELSSTLNKLLECCDISSDSTCALDGHNWESQVGQPIAQCTSFSLWSIGTGILAARPGVKNRYVYGSSGLNPRVDYWGGNVETPVC